MGPLFRDSMYYAFALLWVAIFFGFISEGEIYWWEALCLLCLYGGYVYMMSINQYLKRKVSKIVIQYTKTHSKVTPMSKKIQMVTQMESGGDILNESKKPVTSFTHFRAGILHFMKTAQFEVDNVRVHVVAELEGDMKTTFEKLDTDLDGILDSHEVEILLEKMLDRHPTDKEVKDALKEMGELDGDGHITYKQFEIWYKESEERLEHSMIYAFRTLRSQDDKDVSDKSMDAVDIKKILGIMGYKNADDQMVSLVIREFDDTKDGKISLESLI